MVDAFLDLIARAPRIGMFMGNSITALFEEASPGPRNQVVTLMSPHAHWRFEVSNKNTVTWWAVAVLAVPYTEEVCRIVVDTLLQIASNDRLQPHIPIEIWAWLKKQPSLPPICRGRQEGTTGPVVRRVREFRDVELLESYFLLVWSEWNLIYSGGLPEMRTSIREDLGGIGMRRHREVLIGRLDHVLGELDRGLEHLKQHNPTLYENHILVAKERYGVLKEELLETDRKALKILTRTPFRLTNLFDLLTSLDIHRIPLDVHLRAPSPMSVAVRP